jgi:hypothetical protein
MAKWLDTSFCKLQTASFPGVPRVKDLPVLFVKRNCCDSNLNMHANHLGNLLKCRFCFSNLEWALHFYWLQSDADGCFVGDEPDERLYSLKRWC